MLACLDQPKQIRSLSTLNREVGVSTLRRKKENESSLRYFGNVFGYKPRACSGAE